MLQLALETSGMSGSVALLDGARLLAVRTLAPGQKSAQALAPAMQALLVEQGHQPRDIKLVGVAVGPGSFTGLRIGITTAKLLAYALSAEVVAVNTLEVIARQVPPGHCLVEAILDAQRGELFAASWQQGAAGLWKEYLATRLLSREQWLADLAPDTFVTGPGLSRLTTQLPASVQVVDPGLWTPQASTVGLLAYERFLAGQRDDVFQLVPQYFRRTAAEEQWERKQAARQ